MADVDYDKLSDEDFENLLDNIDDVDADDSAFEDTDQTDTEPEEDETEEDTTQDDDDGFDDTDDDLDEEDEESDEENTHVDNANEDDSESEDTGSDEETEEDESTTTQDDPESMTSKDKVDYRKAYEEAIAEKAQYEDFYNQATGEFVANGRVMQAPKDPKKIIQALQKAAGFDDKMKAFKKYRPFITPLQEKGILDDPDKFNLMMSAMDGDTEAIKKVISNAELDPIELDMENIDYKSANLVSSNIELAYEDVMESAEQNGVREQVQKVVGGDWDDKSIVELLEDPENSADLVQHLSTGIYDLVQERIAQKKMTDPNDIYGNKSSIEQYREAAKELDSEYANFLQRQQQEEQQNISQEQQQVDNGYGNQEFQFTEDEILEEIERIKQERSYSAKVEKKNKQADEGRKRAASVSKKKPRSKKKNTSFDPGKLSDDEFTAYLDGMIYD